ncbi:MAG: hypothetical protein ACRC1W_17805 [Shewanella sp.]
MSQIPFTIGNVASIGVAPINASATNQASGTGGASVFAGLVVSNKGLPFELLRVTKQNWQQVLGVPFRPNEPFSTSLRCLDEALNGGDGYVVRVTPEAAKYPILVVKKLSVGTGFNETLAISSAFGDKPIVTPDSLFSIFPVDGDATVRSVSLEATGGRPNELILNLYSTDALGAEFLDQSWAVSSDPLAVDDFGNSLFIEEVLNRTNAKIRYAQGDTPFVANDVTGIEKVPFVGAFNGDNTTLKATDYAKGVAILRSTLSQFTAVVGLGLDDSNAIEGLVTVANGRRIDMFADVVAPNYAAAVAKMKSSAFNYERLAMYFFPYTAKDPYYGIAAAWPISGIAFAAKAKGVAVTVGGAGGWHYSPAGVERGIINRKEVKPFANLDEPDYEALYAARINKLALSPTGHLMIDDAITTRVKADYLLFQHIGSTMDAISRDFASLAATVKHEPDAITHDGLLRGMTSILDTYVASGALVPPRDPDDGEIPYVLEVVQVAIDYWEVRWAACVTGSSRRILGVPALIR